MSVKKTAFVAITLLVSSLAHAGWSANLGFASDYYFRGIFQSSSTPSGGVDFEQQGFYAGVWAADVDDGLEVDGYFGYGGEIEDFGYSIGYTGYFYTGDFDDTYQEINLGGSYGIVSLDVAVGRYDAFTAPTQDYTYYALTVEQDGFYGKYAGFSQDFKGDYFEVGYGTTISDIDVGIALLVNDKDLAGATSGDETLIFTLGKSFDLQ